MAEKDSLKLVMVLAYNFYFKTFFVFKYCFDTIAFIASTQKSGKYRKNMHK